ncbi:hypothetical protein D3C86_1730820 [compost metagenome]
MVVQRSTKSRDGFGHQFGRLKCQPLLGHVREGALFVEQLCLDLGCLGLERGDVVSHVTACAAGNVARLLEPDVGVSTDRETVLLAMQPIL